MKFLQRWLFAIKINSWPKMLVPFLWGQSLGIYSNQNLDSLLFFLGFLFTFFLTIFIVLLNDYWDQKVDGIKRSLYPNSGSPKTIPDGILPAKQILIVGIFAGLSAVLLSVIIEYFFDRTYFSILGIFCLTIFLLYSAPPIRLNYLGGGELLEMFGVGFVLPYCNYFIQAGELDLPSTYMLFSSSVLFALASAIASGLSDEISDREGGKKTFVTKWGNAMAKKLIILLSIISAIVLILSPIFVTKIFSWIDSLIFTIFNLYFLKSLIKKSKYAITDAFPELNKFKSKLHILIWGNYIFISTLLVVKNLGFY